MRVVVIVILLKEMKFLELSIVSVVSNWPWDNKPDYNNVLSGILKIICIKCINTRKKMNRRYNFFTVTLSKLL